MLSIHNRVSRSAASRIALPLLLWLIVWIHVSRAIAGPPSESPDTQAPADPIGPAAPPDALGPAVDADPTPATDEPAGPDGHAIEAARVRERAERIVALIEGTLDPQISATELFEIDLTDTSLGAARLRSLLVTVHEARAALQAQARIDEAPTTQRKRGQPSTPAEPPAPIPEPPLAGPDADALTRAQSELTHAMWRFLTLPASRRAAVLEAHANKRAEAAANRNAESKARARLDLLRGQATRLAALIDGTLDVSVDPRSLLQIDLSDPSDLVDEARLARVLGVSPAQIESTPQPNEAGVSPAGAAGGSWSPTPELASALAQAEDALDRQRMRFMALDADERAAVLATHAQRQQAAAEQATVEELIEADEEVLARVEVELTEAEGKAASARRDREQAEAAAAVARSEALRRIGEERARLLGVKEEHANYEVELKTREKDAFDAHEVALRWDRDVNELAAGPATDSADLAREAAADAMYADLRTALEDARDHLRDTLEWIAAGDSGVASVGEPLSGLPDEVDHSDILELRAEVEASERALRTLETEVIWSTADLGRDDIVTLNAARLMLLDLASDGLRGRMTGFGRDGVAQVRREIDQIGLELRYRALSLPRLGQALLSQFERTPVVIVLAGLELLLLIIVFRFWRRRARALLKQWHDSLLAGDGPPSRLAKLLATALWYAERVRRPLEWLLLFFMLFRSVLPESSNVEVEAIWLVISWLLVGSTVILLVDAIAEYENLLTGRGNSGSAKLRIRSLRMVGLTIVWTGLILSLTEEIVGVGAIHKWVRSLVWIAAIPILLVLIRWWRGPAFRRIEHDPELADDAVTRWIRAHREGWTSFLAAALAGGYLFVRGVLRWLLRRATGLELMRRVLAWMFRREVLRQASARREDETLARPLEGDEYAKLDPSASPDLDALSPTLRQIGSEVIDEIVELELTHGGTLSAVIGERGAGKTTLLRRIEVELQARTASREPSEQDDGRRTIHRVQCPPGGIEALQRVIAVALGLAETAEKAQVLAELAKQAPSVFLIDDAHRLVRPAIGGLEGLDRLTDFAREAQGNASWVLSIDAAAWQYVSRARGERVLFDEVLVLPRWTEQAIGELIRSRSELASLRPSFAEIVIPRRLDVSAEAIERPTPQQRAEFGLYRILWDYARGNPAVALQFWRESLYLEQRPNDAGKASGTDESDASDAVVVRLFSEPRGADLDEVNPTMHFVLRAVMQLELASVPDLVACTQLPPAEVADALRYALSRSWIYRVEKGKERYRVSWHWYRAIADMLRRQHLLEI